LGRGREIISDMEGFMCKWHRWRRVLWVREENGKGMDG